MDSPVSEDGQSPSEIIEGFESIQLENDDDVSPPPPEQNHGEKSFDEFVGCKSSGEQTVMEEEDPSESNFKDSSFSTRSVFDSENMECDDIVEELTDRLHATEYEGNTRFFTTQEQNQFIYHRMRECSVDSSRQAVRSEIEKNDFGWMSCPNSSRRLELSLLQEIIIVGDSTEMGKLLKILESSLVDLMTNKRLPKALQKILDQCSPVRKDLVVEYVLSRIPFFIDAASSKQGANSVIGFLRRVKRRRAALSITRLLSRHFFAMMSSDTAKGLILHCLAHFPQDANEILYEKAIAECRELAIHKVGCISLNDLIATTTRAGQGIRLLLLNAIADCADSLSYDPYGNYVVQNVLSLGIESISDAIALRMRGEIVQLAKQQGGSCVLEKCMEASELGLRCVVREICATPGASIELALDEVGNYVIQKALNKTKDCGRRDLHGALVKSLKAYKKQLTQTIGGRRVLGLLKHQLSSTGS